MLAIRAFVFAPISEELVFRAVMVPALYMALVAIPNTSSASIVVTTTEVSVTKSIYTSWAVVYLNPLCFAMAHLHHFLERIGKINSNNTTSWRLIQHALLLTLMQIIYTSIFGMIATLLFMRTGSIYSAITSHCICNFMGLPDIGFMIQPGGDSSTTYSCMYNYRYIHLVLHALGLIIFAYAALPLTESLSTESIYW